MGTIPLQSARQRSVGQHGGTAGRRDLDHPGQYLVGHVAGQGVRRREGTEPAAWNAGSWTSSNAR